jgi:UDP-N-acetyl-D-glucosamine/UDP-N-acetyl-D-galactosamine dehydrogenase
MNNKKIALIGLGYVGLPLAVAFAEKFQVIGFDINPLRIQELKDGHDRTFEIEDDLLASVKSNIIYTSDIQDTKDCNIYIVTVPTPIDKTNRPDLTPLVESSKTIGTVLIKDDIVIYESTVYPGVTEDICVPELEKSSGMKFNQDFYCGYSPERINPGDREHTVTKILKVTAGSTPEIAKQVDDLYKQIITAGTYAASSIKVAEASKVIENTQRDVNLALINELALIFNQMGINTNEVIEAAATKWNFIKLTPGLVGGHCIGVDPYYLTFKAEELGYKPNLILAARQINNSMSKYVADQAIKEMIKAGKTIKNSEVLMLGVTFKEDCPDMRNTKVIDIIEELKDFGVNVDVYDPWVDYDAESNWYKHGIINDPLTSSKKYDAIIVAVGHEQFKSLNTNDYVNLLINDYIVLDVKGIVQNASWTL